MVQRLFVYGSLQPGESNAHMLAGIAGTWSPGSVHGRLLTLGWGAAMGYTGLVLDASGSPVAGHLFESTDLASHWGRLDAFEGEDYERVLSPVLLADGSVTLAFVYALRREARAGAAGGESTPGERRSGGVDLIVLDMVGTTIRAGDEVPDTFRAVLRAEGISVSDEDLAGIRGRSKREAVAHLLGSAVDAGPPDPRIERVYGRFQEQLRRAYRTAAQGIPGADSALRELVAASTVVLTTGLDRSTASQLLTGLGWDSIGLTGVVTGDDVERGRPAPDLIQVAMERAGVTDAGRVAVVGDTVADLEAAHAAGAGWSVGVLTGAHDRARLEECPHSVLLESVREVPDWLRGVGALGPHPPEP